MTAPKRERVIKIRATEAEFARLKVLSGEERLAEWMREQCLGDGKAPGRRRTPVPKPTRPYCGSWPGSATASIRWHGG